MYITQGGSGRAHSSCTLLSPQAASSAARSASREVGTCAQPAAGLGEEGSTRAGMLLSLEWSLSEDCFEPLGGVLAANVRVGFLPARAACGRAALQSAPAHTGALPLAAESREASFRSLVAGCRTPVFSCRRGCWSARRRRAPQERRQRSLLKVGAGIRSHRGYLSHFFWWIARRIDSAVDVEFQKDVHCTKERLKGSGRQLRISGGLALGLNSVLWQIAGSWEPRALGVNVPYGSVPLSLDCILAALV